MDNRKLALSLLFLAVTVSGCSTGPTGGSGQAIAVSGPTIQPSEIFEGASVRVNMGVRNTGEVEADVNIGSQGKKVLTDYCPDFFSIQSFSAHSSTNPGTAESYTLSPDERLQMNWELQQEGGNVPLNGYRCPMSFQVPFEYSVEAYQQIQLKRSEEQNNVPLSSQTSAGPLNIAVQTIGSSSVKGAPVFLKGDDAEVLVQLTNSQPEESVHQGAIRIENLEVSATQFGLDCGDYEEPIKLNTREESQIVRCDITGMDDALGDKPSVRSEITASADYTYVKNLGTREVRVKYSGN